MSLFIILFLLGAVVGYVLRPVMARHKHDYEVLWHSTFDEVSFPIVYSVTDREKFQHYTPSTGLVSVTYKRCTKCKNCDIQVHISGRDKVTFDFDLAKATLDKHRAEIKEKEDQALLDSVNRRMGLTSPEVPYNPGHGNQATPQ